MKDRVSICVSWAVGCSERGDYEEKRAPNLNKKFHVWSIFSVTHTRPNSCHFFGASTSGSSKESKLRCSWLPQHSDCISGRAHAIFSTSVLFSSTRRSCRGQRPRLTNVCALWALLQPDSARHTQYMLTESKGKWTSTVFSVVAIVATAISEYFIVGQAPFEKLSDNVRQTRISHSLVLTQF